MCTQGFEHLVRVARPLTKFNAPTQAALLALGTVAAQNAKSREPLRWVDGGTVRWGGCVERWIGA